jgi:hypothetical protein
MLSNSILASNIITYKKDIDYLISNKFKDCRVSQAPASNELSGGLGKYGLNFLGAKPIIKYNNDLWIFIHWQIGVDVANFVNVKGEIFSFNPHHKHSDIIRMIEDN